jgi:hypothetical protein
MLANQRRIPGGRAGGIVAVIVMGLVLGACGAGALAPAPQAGTGDGAAKDAAGRAPAGEGDLSFGPVGQAGSGVYDVNRADLLIIKTGTMSIQVTGLDAAISAVSQKVSALGGYASGSERQGDGDAAYATVTYRIPAASWDEALASIRGQAVKVLGEQSGTQDVTGQVLDLGARIRNLQATESALQAIMTRAAAIKDVLEVQAQLTSVREQIEQLTTQKTHLEQQAAMSTLTVTFSLKPDPVLTSQSQFDPGTEVDQAAASLVSVLQALATAGIWFAIVWLPILIALGVIAGVVVLVVRRVRRSSGGGAVAVSPGGTA